MIEFFKRRPLCLSGTSYLVSLLLLCFVSPIVKILIGIIVFVCTVIAAVFKRKLLLVLIPLMLSAAVSFCFFEVYYKGITDYIGETAEIEAVALKCNSYSNYGAYYDILITKFDGKDVNFKASLSTSYECDLSDNECFGMNVTITELEDDIFGFPEKLYNMSKGIYVAAASEEIDSCRLIGEYLKNINYYIGKLNYFIRSVFRKRLSKDSFELVSTVIQGNRDAVSDNVKRNFRILGITHILVVSGLHLIVIIGGFLNIGRALTVKYKLRYIIAIFVTLFYIILTGASASILRAGIMYIILIVAGLTGGQYDSPTALFAAVTLICIFSPDSIFDTGLWLSFASSLGIVTMGNSLSHKLKLHKPLKTVYESVILSFSAQLYILPVLCFTYREISTVSIISTLIFLIPISLIIRIAPFIIIFDFLPGVSAIFAEITDILCSLTLRMSDHALKIPNTLVALNYDFVPYIIALFAVCLIIITLFNLKGYRYIILSFLICGVVFSVGVNVYNNRFGNTVGLIYYTQGKNDGIAIMSEDRTMICDISSGSYSFAKAGIYYSFEKLHSVEIDTYVLTHLHRRHISSCYKLLNRNIVRRVVIPEPVSEIDFAVYEALISIFTDSGTEVLTYSRNDGGKIVFYNAEVKISPYMMIKRSSHPVMGLTVKTDTSSVAYFGSSGYLLSDTGSYDYTINGNHGPVQENYMPSAVDDYIELMLLCGND